MITATMTIGSVSLIPAYLSAKAQLVEVTRYNQLQGETRDADKRDTAVQTARLVNVQVEELSKADSVSATHTIELLMRDWETHAQNIIIVGFDYSSFKEEGEEETVQQLRVSGEARDRATLNAFVQTLRADSIFSNVSFPVSDLAGGGTLDFSLIVQLRS